MKKTRLDKVLVNKLFFNPTIFRGVKMKKMSLILIVTAISFLVLNSQSQTGSNTSPEATGTVNSAGANINDPVKDSRGRMKAPRSVKIKKSVK